MWIKSEKDKLWKCQQFGQNIFNESLQKKNVFIFCYFFLVFKVFLFSNQNLYSFPSIYDNEWKIIVRHVLTTNLNEKRLFVLHVDLHKIALTRNILQILILITKIINFERQQPLKFVIYTF